MLLRLLSLVLLSAPVIFVTLWFSDNPGQVVLEWLGWRIESNVPILLVALLVVFVVLFVIEQGLSSLTALPVRLRRSRKAKGVEKGLNALIEALDAAAAGDTENGRRLSALASRNLNRPDLAERLDRLMPRSAALPDAATPLSTAKAAGRKPGWWQRWKAPKPGVAPPRRAVSAPPASPPPAVIAAEPPPAPSAVAETPLDRDALTTAIGAGEWETALTLAGPAPSEWRNMVLTGQASSLAATDPQRARDLAGQALAFDPVDPAAAGLALRLDVALGRRDDAMAVLANLWRSKPSYALLTQASPLWDGEDAATRAAWIETLVKANPDHSESHLVLGAQAVADGHWGAARLHLVASIKANPSAAAMELMAVVEQQDGGDVAAVEMWKRRASAAAR